MLQVKNLDFNYPNRGFVLRSVDLELKPGNIYGLFGKNGEGKSTLIKIMAGLLFPKSGICNLNHTQTKKRSPKTLQEIFLVPENFELPALPISTFEKINSSFYPNFSNEQFYGLLEEFQLHPSNKISTLSFGQKKKVLIAFGIATNTKILLMDEPTNGLDIPSKSQFRKVMASAVDKGQCIVVSTHQVRDLHSLINHVIILDNSKVIFDHPLEIISKNLWFGRATQDMGEVIYSEGPFGGRSILTRKNLDETEVDLELLFNGVLQETQNINQAIKK
ncbi:ATP-binding cassette domain-containing protein [Flagellimonas nanhaiensis]|uniref:ABC transporter ATP-binding protein n=1 Tax=Flagellimonas nanhaiensis TaxID=2292706 RepID=A0A371JTU5_9FLAO|nr:ABC transporter ATP-binding protein [Allomuricauda nanhaiensis]RDY61242.1 ABC transporter ATP-binding protein [Allomuricauda nanhaiensis]